jgi:hypothetical protein
LMDHAGVEVHAIGMRNKVEMEIGEPADTQTNIMSLGRLGACPSNTQRA